MAAIADGWLRSVDMETGLYQSTHLHSQRSCRSESRLSSCRAEVFIWFSTPSRQYADSSRRFFFGFWRWLLFGRDMTKSRICCGHTTSSRSLLQFRLSHAIWLSDIDLEIHDNHSSETRFSGLKSDLECWARRGSGLNCVDDLWKMPPPCREWRRSFENF